MRIIKRLWKNWMKYLFTKRAKKCYLLVIFNTSKRINNTQLYASTIEAQKYYAELINKAPKGEYEGYIIDLTNVEDKSYIKL